MLGLLDAEAASNMLAWDHSGFSIDASVRISLDDRDVPSYTKSLEHLVRYCARPAFALERLTAIGGGDGRPEKVRYTLPRHKRGQWIGPGRNEKATAPDAQGVVTLSPHDFLDRLADLVPPPRRHRHRYHGVFAPNHPLRAAVTARAIGNVGKSPAAAGQPGQPAGGADTQPQKRSHDTSCIAWAKLLARIAEAFPLVCPACGGDIRLIAFRLLSECETLHGLRTLCSPPAAAVLLSAIGGRPPAGAGSLRTGGSQAGEGQDGFASVKSSRHRCHPPGVHPRTGMSSFRPMTIVTSCRPRPTSFPRSTSTHSETPAASDARAGLRPRRNQALARGRRGPESATIAGSEGPHRGEPADHPPADACGSAVGRPILGADGYNDLKTEEWLVLRDPTHARMGPDFTLRRVDVPSKYRHLIEDVVLVELLREVRAMVGFTRFEYPSEYTESDEMPAEQRAPISRHSPRWVPVSEVRGEGLFIRFRESTLEAWVNSAECQSRTAAFARAHREWRDRRGIKNPAAGFPGLRYALLHTFSHALMRQFSLECGYPAASIRERIYSADAGEPGGPMAGILLYTAAPDSEGTLGGMVALGEPDTLGRHIDHLLEQNRICASDPLCAEHLPPQDGLTVHGAACHACLFAPETSCERGNRFLDRSLVVETFRTGVTPFFHPTGGDAER